MDNSDEEVHLFVKHTTTEATRLPSSLDSLESKTTEAEASGKACSLHGQQQGDCCEISRISSYTSPLVKMPAREMRLLLIFVFLLQALFAKPIQLLKLEESNFIGTSDGLSFLRQMPAPIVILGAAGRAKSGKSTLLNHLFFTKFSTSAVSEPGTTGLWLWSEPSHVIVDGQNATLLLLDTEGLAAPGSTKDQDAKLLLWSVLLSSNLIYIMHRSLDQNHIRALHPAITWHWYFRAHSSTFSFPSLYWVITSYGLMTDYSPRSAHDMLARELKKRTRNSLSQDERDVNEVIDALEDAQQGSPHEGIYLREPSREVAPASFCYLERDNLDEKYIKQLEELSGSLLANLKIKRHGTRAATGADLASLIEALSKKMNDIAESPEEYLREIASQQVSASIDAFTRDLSSRSNLIETMEAFEQLLTQKQETAHSLLAEIGLLPSNRFYVEAKRQLSLRLSEQATFFRNQHNQSLYQHCDNRLHSLYSRIVQEPGYCDTSCQSRMYEDAKRKTWSEWFTVCPLKASEKEELLTRFIESQGHYDRKQLDGCDRACLGEELVFIGFVSSTFWILSSRLFSIPVDILWYFIVILLGTTLLGVMPISSMSKPLIGLLDATSMDVKNVIKIVQTTAMLMRLVLRYATGLSIICLLLWKIGYERSCQIIMSWRSSEQGQPIAVVMAVVAQDEPLIPSYLFDEN